MSAPDDHVLHELREQVSATDRAIVHLVNERVKLVAEIKAYKSERGIDFLDPERERLMLENLTRTNGGPLSGDGVRELLQALLDLSKREVSS